MLCEDGAKLWETVTLKCLKSNAEVVVNYFIIPVLGKSLEA
jgi:hypothetical protein